MLAVLECQPVLTFTTKYELTGFTKTLKKLNYQKNPWCQQVLSAALKARPKVYCLNLA